MLANLSLVQKMFCFIAGKAGVHGGAKNALEACSKNCEKHLHSWLFVQSLVIPKAGSHKNS